MKLRMSLFMLPVLSFSLGAQTQLPSPAGSYEARFAEVMALAPREDRVARVDSLVIVRDVGRITLWSGSIALLSSVGGRTVGAVFHGRGVFSFAPPSPIEQDRLFRFERTRSLETVLTDVVFLFADTTQAELESKLHFVRAPSGEDMRAVVRKSLEYLSDDDSRSFDPDLMAAFLNGESSDLFYAHVKREEGGPLMFMVNPFDFEGVTLSNRAPRTQWTHEPEVICRFSRAGLTPETHGGARLGTATIGDYRLDVTMTEALNSSLTFTTAARLAISGVAPIGPWVPFDLFPALRVDSARWEGGGPAIVFRGKDAPWLWVNLERRLQPGEVRPLLLYYHGDLIKRYGNFFFIKSTVSWYPRSLEWLSHATFDITYHTPAQYLIASVGDRSDSTVTARVLTTRWVSSTPIRNASFNLGLFEDYQMREAGLPPITVMVSEEEHRLIAREFAQHAGVVPEQRHMKETVGEDVLQSLKFFQHVYGPLAVRHFYATEIPSFEGEAFPGLVDLSWVTFQQTDAQGWDQVFRAHEVAHQWWGVGVDFATYHDQWLSEGFANFSGLWYLQAARKDNDKYFAALHRWRADILLHREEPSPIWLGYRISTSKDETGYQVLVYQKGAWVLHMLRVLMLDLRSLDEERFSSMMQDFYQTYRGRRASTDDFQRKVEEYSGIGMDWFFKDWVYGTGIPTYRVAYRTTGVDNGRYHVTLRVAQENVPDDFTMYVPVTIDLGEHREVRVRVKVSGATSEIELPLLPSEPKGIKFNALDGVLCDVKMVGW